MIKPRGDRVIVQRVEAATMSSGGIAIAAQSQEAEAKGTIVAVGPLHTNDQFPSDLRVGIRVLFTDHAARQVGPPEQRLFLVADKYVVAIEEGE